MGRRILLALVCALAVLGAVGSTAKAQDLVVEESDSGGFIFFHYDFKVYSDGTAVLEKNFMRSGQQQVINDVVPPRLFTALTNAVAGVDWANQTNIGIGFIWDVATVTYTTPAGSFNSGPGERTTPPPEVEAFFKAMSDVFDYVFTPLIECDLTDSSVTDASGRARSVYLQVYRGGAASLRDNVPVTGAPEVSDDTLTVDPDDLVVLKRILMRRGRIFLSSAVPDEYPDAGSGTTVDETITYGKKRVDAKPGSHPGLTFRMLRAALDQIIFDME